ncbi:MAG: hypothetical protein ACI9G1_003052 [Pirellulaceae bacterium]|jgi:uncharacterized protein YqfA (UPF0365 family)
MNPVVIIAIVAFIVVVGLAMLAFLMNYAKLYLQCRMSGVSVGMADLVGMTFRKVPPHVIVRAMIMAKEAGLMDGAVGDLDITSNSLEAHHLAGGHVYQVIRALVAANKAKTIKLTFREATAIDLAGRDVLESVQTSVYPKVIDCPAKGSGRNSLDAVAKDGVQLKVRARVTVRANLQQLIGGAGEETIVARVGEGIVSAIGSAKRHSDVLENPDMISQTVLKRRLDAQTAFEIVSIDIADIDVGDHIGARLEADQAEADTRVARARAEGRRAMAAAEEQENTAHIEYSRAMLVAAEAEVPKAIADAFRGGQLAIMEFYKLRNIEADTEMRTSIATGTKS